MLVSERVERFWSAVPRPFLERVLRSIFANYLLADDQCQEFDLPERTNVRPFLRRGLIEKSIRDIARTFPEQIKAESIRSENKGFWYHTKVICSGDVALTQSTVPHPDEIVRSSFFRNRYASDHNQLYLLPELAPEDLPSDSLLYGIIIHGRSINNARFPGFTQVRFPKPNLDGYFKSIIDLFVEFPEVVNEKKADLPISISSNEMEFEPELLSPSELEEFGT
ncbi:MAG: hypothetical protein ABSA16_16060 [Thermoguttaceae bacterium]|jgi:hypothetical protein